MIPAVDYTTGGSELPRSKLRGIHSGTIIMGAAAPKPLLAHSSRQQADGYSGNTNKISGGMQKPDGVHGSYIRSH